MSGSVRLLRFGSLSPRRELAIVGRVMCETAEVRASGQAGDPAGTLVLAALTGRGRALGRYQALEEEQADASEDAWVRRWTGGHTTVYGDGVLSVSLILPGPGTWLDEPGELPGDRLLNRYVRGLVRGLSRLGLQTAYPGRDFVTVAKKRAAYLCCERDASGVVLVQAIVAAETPYPADPEPAPAEGLPAPPLPTTIADELDADEVGTRLLEAIASGYATQFRLDVEESSAPAEEALPGGEEKQLLPLAHPPADEARLLFRGEPAVIPIGELETFVSLETDGRIARVRLAGDWIADSAGVAALEASLEGVPAERQSLAPVVERLLGDPAHFFIGVTSAEPIVEALLSGARAAG